MIVELGGSLYKGNQVEVVGSKHTAHDLLMLGVKLKCIIC